MCVSSARVYEAGPGAVADARRFAAAFVIALLQPGGWEVADDAVLVVSELVAAAAEDGDGPIRVGIDAHFDRIEVAVTSRPTSAEPAPGVAPIARDRILRGLTAGVTVQTADDGSVVRCAALPCSPEHTQRVACGRR